MAAIEEAVVNAVYHRSYEIREPVEVRITDEDLVVLSYPGPDRLIKMADLREGGVVSRRYRNRRIGEFLKELNLAEGRSTGIAKMLRVMAANGSPAPEFETDEARSYLLVRLRVHERARVTQAAAHVTPHVKLLLEVCDGELTRDELQARLGIADRKHFRAEYLHMAIDQGLIEMTLPDKPKSINQRYRLTMRGREWLDQHRSSR